MNPISLSSTPSNLPVLDAPSTSGPASLQSQLQALNLTIVSGPNTIEGPGGEIRIRLENPTVGPEDIPLNEFLQQLDSLGKTPTQVFILGESVKNLTEGTKAFAQSMQAARANGTNPDPAQVQAMGSQIENQATLVEQSIRDLIENSTYPNFSDFLKELVRISQDLREAASKAKLAAIEGNYAMMMSAADQMVVAAEKAQESREAQIEADKMEAIGQIVSGVVSGIISGGFAIGGATQVGAALGQASSSIITGSFSVSVTNLKTESSNLQTESDLANVAKQRLDAAAKLIDAQTEVARDLGEIAKGLRDMALKIYQDFISSQNQSIQRANV